MVSVISAGLLLLVYGETQFHLVGRAARKADLGRMAGVEGAQGPKRMGRTGLLAQPPIARVARPRQGGLLSRPP